MKKKNQRKTDLEQGHSGDKQQEVDARILGQILAAQNVIFALPDATRIAEFYSQTLLSIPDVTACRVCLANQSIQAGIMENAPCAACEASRQGSDPSTVIPAEPDFKCNLINQPEIRVIAIDSYQHHFGFFVFKINHAAGFNAYQPFIVNLSSYVAITFENRLQKELLQKAHHELERRVEERTHDLTAANEDLQREIAERQRTEKALRESEEQVKRLFDESPVAMVISSGTEERVEWVNDKFIELFGYTIEDMPDIKHWWPLAYPDETDRARVKAQWESNVGRAIREKSQIQPIEATARCKDGSFCHVEFRFSSIGKKHIITFVDLTERKLAEEELIAREREYRVLLENIPDLIVRYDTELQRVYVNPAWERASGLSAGEVVNVRPAEIPKVPSPVNENYLEKLRKVLMTGATQTIEFSWVNAYGVELSLEYVIVPEYDQHGNISGALSVGRDITEHKRAETQLLASEQLFRALVENSPDFVARYDREFRRIYINPAIQKLFGVPAESVIGKTPSDQSPVYAPQIYIDHLRQVIETGTERAIEMPFRTEQGEMHWGHMRFVPEMGPEGRVESVLAIGRDIHEIKENERRFRMLAENFPDLVMRLDRDGHYIYINPAFEKTFGFSAESVIGKTLWELPPFNTTEGNDAPLLLIHRALEEGVANEFEVRWNTGRGERIFENRYVPEKDATGNVVNILCIARDVTERKRSEQALRESEERYRQLVNLSPDAIAVYNQGQIVFANPAAAQIVRAKNTEDLIGRSILDFIHPDFQANVQRRLEEVKSTGILIPFVEEKFLRLDGSTVDVEVAVVPYTFQDVGYAQIVARDITERKRHELEREAIVAVSTSLRQATTSTDILSVILDQLIGLFKADGAVVVLPDSRTKALIDGMGRGPVGERMIGLNIPPGAGIANWVIANQKPYLNNHIDQDSLFYRPDLLGESHCLAFVPLIAQEQRIGVLWIARQTDITEQELRLLNAIADIAANAIHRVKLHEQTVQQLHRLIALHQIDLAISANFDLNVTLNVILKNVKDELEVDAASILRLDAVTHTLDYAAGIGFRTRRIEQSHVRLGNGCAGRAAQEYRTVSYPDLQFPPEVFSRSSLLVDEEFLSHYATPLIVKGQVKGVLEIFHRKRFESGSEWLDYFETLATQSAIAIESASLFENLQRSNLELRLAYDATIEGWSRALDLRDKETEGHTQRVTEMVLQLADRMGMRDSEKLDLRRGSLLHDIGKMGVPDAILLKTGPLSEPEWEIMKQHPNYAYQMLSPIAYLKYALDVPYCHHEQWDGSGYPRGLRGEQIPLAARIFTVVDVFDALTSDRPYRAAWTHEQAYRYIQEEAGRQFDPQVVKIFLETKSS